MTNLGFGLKLGGGDGSEGVPGPQPRAKLAGWRNWQGGEIGRAAKLAGGRNGQGDEFSR